MYKILRQKKYSAKYQTHKIVGKSKMFLSLWDLR